MAKGEAMRRRAKNFMEAKETKSGRLLRLPPPPEAATRKGKKNSDMPRSLRRMLELKALAKGPARQKQKPRSVVPRLPAGGRTQTANGIGQKPAAPKDCAMQSSPAEVTQAADQTPYAAGTGHLFSTPLQQPQTPALESKQEDGKANASHNLVDAARERQRSEKQRASPQQQQPVLAAASSPGTKGLKARKKEFLKRRKLKKKGLLHLLEQEPDLEAELMQDRHKPKFGEQAEAPLKIHLKRKHWDGGAQQQQQQQQQQGRASKRCTDIFQRQLQDASRQQGSGADSLKAHSQEEAGEVPSARKGKTKGRQDGQAGSRVGPNLDAQARKRAQAKAQAQAQAIEAYRSSKRPDAANKASFKTLKELVRKGESAG